MVFNIYEMFGQEVDVMFILRVYIVFFLMVLFVGMLGGMLGIGGGMIINFMFMEVGMYLQV